MPDTKKIICIKCPKGCEIFVSILNNNIEKIENNSCKLGLEYVNEEIKNPKRTFTSLVKVKNGKYPLVPVWTDKPIPKEKIPELIKLTKEIELEAPVSINQIVISNLFGLDVNLITSFYVEKNDE